MDIKELLLNGKSFLALLNQFAIEVKNVAIQGEDKILLLLKETSKDVIKEDICIAGKNESGMFNFFGVLHFNAVNKLAVFEMKEFEKIG